MVCARINTKVGLDWIKPMLYVKGYIILTFDSVHPGVMLSHIHNGVIMANVGH